MGSKSHRMYGRTLPRVTSVLGVIAKGDGFLKWLASHGWKEAQRIKQESAEEGTSLHSIASSLLLGRNVSVSSRYRACVGGIEKAIVRFGLLDGPLEVEHRVVHLCEGYCGTTDFVTPRFLGDWKFGNRLYREYDFQTAAYLMAEMDMFEHEETKSAVLTFPPPKDRLLIRVDDEGNIDYRLRKASTFVKDANAFGHALGLYNELKEND